MQSIKKSVKSPQTTKDQAAIAPDRRSAINELLWDFYDDFPLAFSDWAEVVCNSAQPVGQLATV